MDDLYYMKRALELAKKGRGFTSPNPMVGSVIVKNERIIGEGYHHRYGDKHAEVRAIESASESVEGATLYCNLEPCCHTIPEKKTPPCSLRLIQEKIKRVVVATKDPNPYVNGNGIRVLREHGITVKVGLLAEEAAELNAPYFKYIQTGLPFVHLKIAQSLDGRIATSNGHSRWITNQSARRLVHQWRATYDAVLVGINTVLKDNPSLTVREVPGRNPYRVVLDEELRIPDDARLLSDGLQERTLIFTTRPADHPRVQELQKQEIQVITVGADEHGWIDLQEVLERLGNLKIASLLVEGGSRVFTSFIEKKLFDKISVFLAPIIIGTGINSVQEIGTERLTDALKLQRVHIEVIDQQALVEGFLNERIIFEKALERI